MGAVEPRQLSVVPELSGGAAWRVSYRGEPLQEWQWHSGDPDPRELAPVRGVKSGALSRHIPVQARVSTTDSTHSLESGLELELVTLLDFDPDIYWIVVQPVELRWSDKLRHVPDVLSMDAHGVVTLWDARPASRRDEIFAVKAARTEKECGRVGWRYEKFAGLETRQSLNLRWIAGARREPEWFHVVRPNLVQALKEGPSTIGEIRQLDTGPGFVTSTMWHMVWKRELSIDYSKTWDEFTPIELTSPVAKDGQG